MADINSVSSILESPPTASPTGAGLSRRSVVAAGVFAVPAVTLLSQSPASANTSVLPQIAIEAAGGVIPATGPVAVTVTVRSLAGALLSGQVVSLTGPPDSNFASSDGTTDGSGRFTTTFWLAKPWITPGTTITITAVSTGTSASQAFTVAGSNMLATGPNTWGHIGNGAPGGGWTTPAQTLPVFPSPVVQVASGEAHAVVLLANGTVWTAGNPAFGRLGRDTTVVPYTQFGQVPGLSDVTQIAAQWNGCYALVADKVYAWGWNNWGQVGDGTTTDRDRPTLVSGLSGVTTLAAGRVNGLVILTDGTVRSWGGANEKGQVGNGSTSNQLTPVTVTGLSGIVQLAGGNDTHSALRNDGTVWAWGANDQGQVGDGTNITQLTPVRVAPLNPVRYSAIARGGDTGYAILADTKQVVAWGRNNEGQVGSGPAGAPTELLPREVDGMANTVLLAAGVSSVYAKKADSTVFAWGLNTNGELGTGDTTNRNTPTPVAGLSGRFISAISSGARMTAAYFVAESTSVTVDVDAQVTAGAAGAVTASVVAASSAVMNTALTLSATGNTVLGATSGTTDGAGHFSTTVTPNVWTRPGSILWVTASCNAGTASDTSIVLGANLLRVGQGGARASAPSPIQDDCVFPYPITAVSASGNGALALLTDGSVWQTNGGSWAPVPALSNVVGIGMSLNHMAAVTSDGSLWTWGANGYGQLGLGHTTNATAPEKVPGLTGVVQVSMGRAVTFALTSDGRVWSAGWNANFALGRTGGDSSTFAMIPGLDQVTQVAGNFLMGGLAVRQDGTVWAWGINGHGQLCDGTTTDRATPLPIPGLTGVKKVAGGCSDGYGDTSGYALTTAGALWAWGTNNYGQLGDGTTADKTTPTYIGDGYVDIQPASKALYALKVDRHTLAATGLTSITGIGNVLTPGTIDLGRPAAALSEFAYAAYSNQFVYMITADGTVTVDVDAQVSAGSAGVVEVAVASSSTPVANAALTLSATGGAVLGSASGSTSSAGVYQTTVTPDAWTTPGSVLRVTSNSDLGSGSDTYSVLGANAFRIGTGGSRPNAPVPTQEDTVFPSPIVAFSMGMSNSATLLADGSVWTTGGDSQLLGDGSTAGRNTWGKIPSLPAAASICMSNNHAGAVTPAGELYLWGANNWGQLGFGNTTPLAAPTKVPGLTGVKQVSTGRAVTFVLKTDGTVWAAGWNANSQLGKTGGESSSSSTFVQVTGLPSIAEISAGFLMGCLALSSTGTVWAWGNNSQGQLCDGTTTESATPKQIPGLSSIKKVQGSSGEGYGAASGYALQTDNTLWAWGYNGQGQLGDGTKVNRTTPYKFGDGYADVAAASQVVYALKTDRVTLAAAGRTKLAGINDTTTPATIGLSRPIVAMSEQTYTAYDNQQAYLITG